MAIDSKIMDVARRLSHLGAGPISRHLDELCSDLATTKRPLQYWAGEFYEKIDAGLRTLNDARNFALVVPISISSSIDFNCPNYDTILDFECAVPTLYLGHHDSPLNEAHEEYRLSLDGIASKNCICVYRSWRDRCSALNSWEFSNDVYVWRECQSNEDSSSSDATI